MICWSDKHLHGKHWTVWTASGYQIWELSLKKKFLISTVESTVLYKSEAWSLMAAEEKSLYGMYTRMLRKATIVHWSSHTKNEALYGKLPKLSNKIAAQRLLLAGHCLRHSELFTHTLILCEPTHRQRGSGPPKINCFDILCRDTGAVDYTELASLMADQSVWRDHLVFRLQVP